ncbi:MAG: hypothetical protein ACPLW9_01860 [Minisyncoccales bacterium]
MNLITLGRWSFILGLVLSVVAGLGGEIPALTTILLILGLIVGFLNISEKESTPFLVAVIALIITGMAGLNTIQYIDWLIPILNNLVVFAAAASLIVAVKQLIVLARKMD